MRINFKQKYRETNEIFIVDWLAEHIDLSKMKIKKTIEVGGLWITKNGQKKKIRTKKIKTKIKTGDFIEFNYDSTLEFVDNSEAKELYKGHEFAVWYKPAGMLSDGSPYADKGSLSHVVKQNSKKCFLIQRLDREVSGLMIVAYSKKMAAFFSKELQKKLIHKFYQAQVIGFLDDEGEIDLRLDGKDALTLYKTFKHDDGTSFCEIEIKTGRFHQIRRHFDKIDHPLMGDPRYGEGNKNKDGMKLVAHKCEFFNPKERKRITVELPKELQLF